MELINGEDIKQTQTNYTKYKEYYKKYYDCKKSHYKKYYISKKKINKTQFNHKRITINFD